MNKGWYLYDWPNLSCDFVRILIMKPLNSWVTVVPISWLTGREQNRTEQRHPLRTVPTKCEKLVYPFIVEVNVRDTDSDSDSDSFERPHINTSLISPASPLGISFLKYLYFQNKNDPNILKYYFYRGSHRYLYFNLFSRGKIISH